MKRKLSASERTRLQRFKETAAIHSSTTVPITPALPALSTKPPVPIASTLPPFSTTTASEFTVGVDEAGRGCILGPMFAGIVVWRTSRLEELRQMGVKDSKKLSPKRLIELHAKILEAAEYASSVCFTAQQINEMKQDPDNPQTMNSMDEMLFARALEQLPDRFVDTENPKLALFLDAADRIQERFGKSVLLRIDENRRGMFRSVVSEHKADDRYPIVSAASILAKNAREEWCKQAHATYGNFKSGYCNEATLSWLENWRATRGSFPDICRNWEPCQKIEQKLAAATLDVGKGAAQE